MDWDEIYRTTPLHDLHWYPGEPDPLLHDVITRGWLPGSLVLDVGCGQGTDTLALAQAGYVATGLDLSAVACSIGREEAARRNLPVSFVTGDALKMPFGRAQFDLVTERGCFHHVAPNDRTDYARAIARVLPPGGHYLYRNFCDRSQPHTAPEARLTEEVIRGLFAPFFTIEQFGQYEALGEGGRSSAAMHWALMRRRESLRHSLARTLQAPREAVWQALTQPNKIAGWWGPGAEASVDLTPGGGYRWSMRFGDGSGIAAEGIYRVIRPQERLLFSFAWTGPEFDFPTVVTIDLEDRNLETGLLLTQEGLGNQRSLENHSVGWNDCLTRLGKLLLRSEFGDAQGRIC